KLHHIVDPERPADVCVQIRTAQLAQTQKVRELERPAGNCRRGQVSFSAAARKRILMPELRVRLPDGRRLSWLNCRQRETAPAAIAERPLPPGHSLGRDEHPKKLQQRFRERVAAGSAFGLAKEVQRTPKIGRRKSRHRHPGYDHPRLNTTQPTRPHLTLMLVRRASRSTGSRGSSGSPDSANKRKAFAPARRRSAGTPQKRYAEVRIAITEATDQGGVGHEQGARPRRGQPGSLPTTTREADHASTRPGDWRRSRDS